MNLGVRSSYRVSCATSLAVWLSAHACAAAPGFGPLPPGALAVAEVHDVSAEICRDHLLDPQAVSVNLPPGYRFRTVADAALKNPPLAQLLQSHPRLRGHAVGSLCFAVARQLVVDGMPMDQGRPVTMAFWWASAEGPRHADMRGSARWVQLRSWYSSALQDRAAVLKADPMAEFVDIDVLQLEANRWRLRLALSGETVMAEVVSAGPVVPSAAPQPGFMSVPMSGVNAGYFTVYTYFGHHHQAVQGAWRASGAGVFTDALAIANGSDALGTVFQQGWSARSGLYRFSSP